MSEKIEEYSEEQTAMAAIMTLQGKGYTYHGGQLWKPPIGNKPDFDLLDAAQATIAEQAKMIEHLRGGPTPLYTAVDMANAARDGFRDGAASRDAEIERLKTHVQSMIDQTTPLVPVPGDPMWSRRITIDELRKALAECTASLEGEVLQKFHGQKPEDMHPVTRREYDRDMAEINGYKALSKEG